MSRPYPATPSTPTPLGSYYTSAQTDAFLAASAATVNAALALKAPLITTVLSPSGGVNDQTAINAAITAANTAGGGEVVLVKGDWIISSSIQLKSKVVLRGQGWGTHLQTAGAMTTPAITLASSSVEWAVVKDLHINGGSTNPANTAVDGLYIDNNGGSFSNSDAHLLFENILIRYMTGGGIYARSREARFKNVVVREAYGDHGFELAGTDCFLENVTVATITGSGKNAFHITSSNNHLLGCKAFYSNQHGFYVVGNKTMMAGCAAQENTGSGLYLDAGCTGCVIGSFDADSNGAAGMTLNAAHGNAVQIAAFGTTGLRYPTPTAGVVWSGTSLSNNIQATSFVGSGGGTTHSSGTMPTLANGNVISVSGLTGTTASLTKTF